MLNNPWDHGSKLYRTLVVSALILTGSGVLTTVIGSFAGSVSAFGIPLIGAGLLTHIAGLIVRGREQHRRRAAASNASSGTVRAGS